LDDFRWFDLKTGGDGFSGLASKPVVTVFSSLAFKTGGNGFSRFGLKTGGGFFH
jgi:hypothetical protein